MIPMSLRASFIFEGLELSSTLSASITPSSGSIPAAVTFRPTISPYSFTLVSPLVDSFLPIAFMVFLNSLCRSSQCLFVNPVIRASSTYSVHRSRHHSPIKWFIPSAMWQLKKVADTDRPWGIPDHCSSSWSLSFISSIESIPHVASSSSVKSFADSGMGGAAVSKCLDASCTTADS